MIKSSSQEKDRSHDQANIPALRMTAETRPAEKGESKFVYNASLHAVRMWDCQRLPKKASKKPREGKLFVFPTHIANVYQRGHSEKKSVVKMEQLESIVLEPQGSKILFNYKEGKKDKSITLVLPDFKDAKVAVELVEQIRKEEDKSYVDAKTTAAVAIFGFNTNKKNQISFSARDKLVVLEKVGDWFYGFREADSQRKGLFPVSYVELRPPGVMLTQTMTPEDWNSLEKFFVSKSMKKGDIVIKEGDAVSCGDLVFVKQGELIARAALPNKLYQDVGFVLPGETLGELLFLLGGKVSHFLN